MKKNNLYNEQTSRELGTAVYKYYFLSICHTRYCIALAEKNVINNKFNKKNKNKRGKAPMEKKKTRTKEYSNSFGVLRC